MIAYDFCLIFLLSWFYIFQCLDDIKAWCVGVCGGGKLRYCGVMLCIQVMCGESIVVLCGVSSE